MSDINESFFQGDEDFNPFEITPFATEILNNYKKTVEKFEEGVNAEDVLMVICGLYIQIRETMDSDFLMSTINSALYITEQIIQKNSVNYPGRYPTSKAEAELKYEIEKMFEGFNLDD
tara:strand:+ start:322 stop:675 length:354 start_codon:yes stop_codon:yes gene_type:complete